MAGQSSRSEDALHLWKLAAEELDCFEKPFSFANDSARFKFYRQELSSLHYAPREEFSCTVTMMSGLPGAGKDTWLARNRPDLPVVSLDALRLELDTQPTDDQSQVIHAARDACRMHLRAGHDFAFNATNTMALTRKRWIELFADYNARIEIVYIEPRLDVLIAQNKSRERPVPSCAMERLIDRREPPTITEAHGLLMI
jgi:predicted kinase